MRGTFAVIAALGLSACADVYGYAYNYDPYLGPRGHYVGPFEGRSPPPAPGCRLVFVGPIENSYRGAYYGGPYCAPAAMEDAQAH